MILDTSAALHSCASPVLLILDLRFPLSISCKKGKVNRDDMKARTKAFALPVIHLVEELPKTRTGDVIGKQLLRAATSVGANYRAACRGKSKADFIAKLGTVEEEADECVYWLELIVEAELLKHERIICLIREANEITAIIVSSIRTARSQK